MLIFSQLSPLADLAKTFSGNCINPFQRPREWKVFELTFYRFCQPLSFALSWGKINPSSQRHSLILLLHLWRAASWCWQVQCTTAYQSSRPYHRSKRNRSKHSDCAHCLTWANPRCCYLSFFSLPPLVCSSHLMHLGETGCWTLPSCLPALSWHYQESFCLHCSRKETCIRDRKSLGKRQPLMSALSNGTSGTKPLIKGLKLNSNKLLWSLMILWNQSPKSCWLQWIWALS